MCEPAAGDISFNSLIRAGVDTVLTPVARIPRHHIRLRGDNQVGRLAYVVDTGQRCPDSLRHRGLWSLTRTQLNIKVDPELLKLLSAYPNRQSVTLTKFVVAVLAKAGSGEDPLSLGDRVSRIEKHLGLRD